MQKLCYKLSIILFIGYTQAIISDINMCLDTDERLNKIKPHEVSYLGKGGFGKVMGDNQFAVKNITIQHHSEYVMFKNEMRFMISLGDKPNFIGVVPQMCYYSRDKKQKTKFPVKVKITVDKMIGDLFGVIRKDIPELENPFWHIDVAFQLVAALETLHNSNALHLDIKPDNILFMNKYTPVLADFGLSVRTHIAQTKTRCMGTQFYMGQETLEMNPPRYTPKADIYAMGLVLLELFQLEQLQRKIPYVQKIPDEQRSELTQYFRKMINGMIQYHNYKQRPTTRMILKLLLVGMKTFHNDQQKGDDQDFYPQSLSQYIIAQKDYYTELKNRNDPVTLKYYDQLMANLNQRESLYAAVINGFVFNKQNEKIAYTQQFLEEDLDRYTQGEPLLNEYFDSNLKKKYIFEKEVQVQDDEESMEDTTQDIQMVTIDPDQRDIIHFDQQDIIKEQKIMQKQIQVPNEVTKTNQYAFPSMAFKNPNKMKNKVQKMNKKQMQQINNIYGANLAKMMKKKIII